MLNSQFSGCIKRCVVYPTNLNCFYGSRINIYCVSFCISIDVVLAILGNCRLIRLKLPTLRKATILDSRHTCRQAIGHNALIQALSDGLSNGRKCLIKAFSIIGIIGVLFFVGRRSSNTLSRNRQQWGRQFDAILLVQGQGKARPSISMHAHYLPSSIYPLPHQSRQCRLPLPSLSKRQQIEQLQHWYLGNHNCHAERRSRQFQTNLYLYLRSMSVLRQSMR